MVGPALVLVEAGGGAVSDRVADHHHAACAGCGLDFNPGQEQACGGGGGSIQVARQALVAAGDPTGLAAVPVEGLQRRRPRHENADLQGLLIAGGHTPGWPSKWSGRGAAPGRAATLAAPIRSGCVP
ncbi:hypothetical protein G6F68_017018 [Rhizopus microsporus]|nr:hypothetical protein G6F68_017018 [Rhizopus microsporus]